MANPAVLNVDTTLYCAAEPDGRLFPAGTEWPGDAWTTNPSGKPIGDATVASAAKDLAKAQEQANQMTQTLASKDHDLAVIAAQRDEAVGRVAELEQRALAAEQGQDAADRRAKDYMTERDAARSDFQRVSDQVTEANARLGDLQHEAAKVPDLTAQLETANQTIADLNGKVAELEKDLEAATAPPAKSKAAAKAEAPAADVAEGT